MINWKNVSFFATDCDGVLTNGTVTIDTYGVESRHFHIHDGHGLKSLMKAGIHVAIISAANAPSIQHRGEQLGIQETHTGVSDKTAKLIEIAEGLGVSLSDTVFMGDDMVDLGPMGLVGFPVSVSNGRPEVRAKAIHVTQTPGGSGAVRDVCDLILNARSG